MKKLYIEVNNKNNYLTILKILSLLEDKNLRVTIIEKEESPLISFNPENLIDVVEILKSNFKDNEVDIITSIDINVRYRLPIKVVDNNVYILDSSKENDIKYAFSIKERYFIDLKEQNKIYEYFKFLELCNGKDRNYFDRAYELLRVVTQLYYNNLDLSEKELSSKFLKFYNTLLYSNIKVRVDGCSELYFKFKNDPYRPRLITWVDNSDGSWGFWLTLKNIINNSILTHLRSIDDTCHLNIIGSENSDLDVNTLRLLQVNTYFGSIILFTFKKYSNYVIVYYPNKYCSISTLNKLNLREDLFNREDGDNLFLEKNEKFIIEYDFLSKDDIEDEKEHEKLYHLFKQLLEQDMFSINNNSYVKTYNPNIFIPKDDIFSYFLTSIIP